MLEHLPLINKKKNAKKRVVKEPIKTELSKKLEKLQIDVDSNHEKLISDALLETVRDDILKSHTNLLVSAMDDKEKKKELELVIKKEHRALLKSDTHTIEDIAKYIVREISGTGIIEEILKDETVEDITWDGTNLIVETADTMEWIDTEKFPIEEAYIRKIVARFATEVGKDFSQANPIIDAKYDNMRLNAVHASNSTSGTTLSLRVLRKKLALNRDNFNVFAPDYMLEFFDVMVKTHVNMTISGETGTGKTEFQKLLLSMVNQKDKMILIEDVPELQIKEIFPEKMALSWITGNGQTIADFVKASLRNKPVYVVVSETRGSEAFEMLEATLSGHYVLTSLHTISARATVRRFVNMCVRGFSNVNAESVKEDFLEAFNFGCHIKRVEDLNTGKKIRYLSELVEFKNDEIVTIFKQRYLGKGRYRVEFVNDISDEIREKMEEQHLNWMMPPKKYWNDREINGKELLERQEAEQVSLFEKIEAFYNQEPIVSEIMDEIKFVIEVKAFYTLKEEEQALINCISKLEGNDELTSIEAIVKNIEKQEQERMKQSVNKKVEREEKKEVKPKKIQPKSLHSVVVKPKE